MTQEEDILGVAGAVEDDSKQAREHTCVLSKVRHGRKQAVAGEREYSGMAGCETVDECFFGGHTDFFLHHPFDENYVIIGIYMAWSAVCIPVQKETKSMYVISH